MFGLPAAAAARASYHVDSGVIVRAPVRYLVAGMGDARSTWYEARAAAAAGRPDLRGGAATQGAR
ncbi:MAG: hypothetical protein ACKOHG_08665, partial [Planctomycetia bacterium]